MRVLIDECLPRALKRLLPGHDCRTVQELGWSGQKNGALLALAETEFDVLVTVDQGMGSEQSFAGRQIALVVLVARSNQVEDLEPLLPAALAALAQVVSGSITRVGA